MYFDAGLSTFCLKRKKKKKRKRRKEKEEEDINTYTLGRSVVLNTG
jgi:hypothetical protein